MQGELYRVGYTKWDAHGVGSTQSEDTHGGSGVGHMKWDTHGLGYIGSWIHTEWDTYMDADTHSEWDTHRSEKDTE